MNFKRIQGKTSVKNLESLGFLDGDYVLVLFADGRVLCGNLNYVTEYSTLFDTQLVLEHVYWKVEDMSSAIGICKIVLED